MATPERALLDALDRPHHAGGLGEVYRMVARALSRLAPARLVELLGRWGAAAPAQRLGYLADLHGVELPPATRAALERLARPGGKLLLGPRWRWGTTGTLVRPWNIIENVPRAALVEVGAAPRRRVRFAREPRRAR